MSVNLKYRVDIDKDKDPITFDDLAYGQVFIWLGEFGNNIGNYLTWIKLSNDCCQPINNYNQLLCKSHIEGKNMGRKLVQECTLVLE